jgi:hypothetical protein
VALNRRCLGSLFFGIEFDLFRILRHVVSGVDLGLPLAAGVCRGLLLGRLPLLAEVGLELDEDRRHVVAARAVAVGVRREAVLKKLKAIKFLKWRHNIRY